MRRSTCRIAATRHAQVEQDDMCAPRARAGQSRMKIAEGMTCAPVGNAAACVSVRPVHLRRHAPQVCAHSSPCAHAARTTATGETEFFERGTEFSASERSEALETVVAPRQAQPARQTCSSAGRVDPLPFARKASETETAL